MVSIVLIAFFCDIKQGKSELCELFLVKGT